MFRFYERLLAEDENENEDRENLNPNRFRNYIRGLSSLLTIPAEVRDRGILEFQRQRDFRYLRLRLVLLTRYMVHSPFPGQHLDIWERRAYAGPDYYQEDLEHWLEMTIARATVAGLIYCEPMTHQEYVLMRTACLTMMRTMLCEIPGILNRFPALWYTFDSMGDLLDALNTWTFPLPSQMTAVNEFFNNPPWLPTDTQNPPFLLGHPLSNRVVRTQPRRSINQLRHRRPSIARSTRSVVSSETVRLLR